ncbi:hypothetical protein ABF638_33590 [Nostoc sp. CALU 1950]
MLLTYQNLSVSVSGLLDTGFTVNVLPYEIGLRLEAGLKYMVLLKRDL